MPNNFNLALTVAVLPEAILVVVAGCCALLAGLRPGERPDLYRWMACIALAGAVAAAALALFGMRLNKNGVALVVWGGGLTVDHFSLFITVAVCAFALVTCFLSDVYIRRVASRSGAFFAMLLIATAATAALAAERDMVTLFVTLETLIVSTTVITALVKTREHSAEAAFKYLVEAGVTSAMLLYGFAILYGVTGSTNLASVAAALHRAPAPAALGVALVVLALTFSLGIFPLRQWVGRAAEALPATAAGFVVTIGITAGAVAWVRVGVTGFGSGVRPWTGLAAVIVAGALVYTSVAAMREHRISRLIGVAASNQAAFLLLAAISFKGAITTTPAAGTTALLFGVAVFGFATLAGFALLAMLQSAGIPDGTAELRGLARRSSPAAALLALVLLTLAGVPPLAGFVGRFLAVESAMAAGYGWLVVVALATTVVSAIAVVRVVVAMFAEPGPEAPFNLTATPRLGRVVAVLCVACGFLLTFVAQPVLMLARAGAGPLH